MRILVLLLVLLVGLPATAAPPVKSKLEFARVVRNAAGKPAFLETAITRFQSPKGWTVDLIGALHIGERSYFRQLNQEFTGYDSVLYELIAPSEPGTKPVPVKGQGRDNPLSAMQNGLCKMLGLDFQLDYINYEPENLVHADISPDEFAASMKQRKESIGQLIIRAMQTGETTTTLVSEEEMAKLDPVSIMLGKPSEHDRRVMRLMMAESFTNMETLNQILNGGEEGSTLLTVRNDRALQGLKQQVAAGDKKIAIYYGAAHMPDMAQKLIKEFKLKPAGQRWVKAWNLDEAKS